MLESPTTASAPVAGGGAATCSAPTTNGSSLTTQHHHQMAKNIKNGDFTENYFASLSGPAKRLIEDVVAVKESYEDVWTDLAVSEQEDIINETIIRPEAILRYEKSSVKQPSAEVRLSSFGVDKVFPRLKVQSGQKETTFEDTTGSQGEDLGSDCTYSYRDEHSGPWSWMTRSQQELSFESGPIEYIDETGSSEEGLETLGSPSRILNNRQSLLVRQSKGNPLYAKPVGIPIVPTLQQPKLVKMDKPLVSPHKINNFVYEEDNRIILDFGMETNIDNALKGNQSPSNQSEKSTSSSLLAKMKEKKNTLKKSLSNVSSNAGGTLRRKKSSFKLSSNSSPSSTLSSTISHESSMTSSSFKANNVVVKPSIAPPPPPPANAVNKPSTAPPPPPPRQTEKKIVEDNDIVKPLEEFKIDLNTESDIPKTGFDFLDNW